MTFLSRSLRAEIEPVEIAVETFSTVASRLRSKLLEPNGLRR
jgi:hypothetical protein